MARCVRTLGLSGTSAYAARRIASRAFILVRSGVTDHGMVGSGVSETRDWSPTGAVMGVSEVHHSRGVRGQRWGWVVNLVYRF